MIWLLLACTDAPVDSAPVVEEAYVFSFAVFADPHVTQGAVEHQDRLDAAVDWVAEQHSTRGIELVWVVGDVGWSEGLPIAKASLDRLPVPYLPVLGDNEVHFGDEQVFDDVFAEQYALLADTLPGWERGAVEVHNTVYDQTSWLQNFRFTYRGLTWVGLDWVSRSESDLLSELAELNDFPEGSLPFFEDALGTLEPGPGQDVLLFSHHPMHLGSFNLTQMEALLGLIGPLGDRIGGAWAGHVHLDATVEVDEGGYTVWVTDALWDDELTVRVVDVYEGPEGFRFEQELVVLPW